MEANQGKLGSQLVKHMAGTGSSVLDPFPSVVLASLRAVDHRCCTPLPKLVENPLSRGGHTQIAGFGAFSKNGGTHTVPLRGAHVKNLNSHQKSLRNKRKERQKEQR